MTARRERKLGTFSGVFTPSVLTILGIVLFLRLGFVVGSAGLAMALAILLLATAISTLTSLSLAAIATNRKVRGGGDYYLISRSLGVEYGGALGLVLFFAQAVSVAFYCTGFGEGVVGAVPAMAGWERLAAVGAALVLLSIAYLGADLATRFQYGVMAVLIAALVSFFAGGVDAWDAARLEANVAAPPAAGFWVLFAIFFPAVTGFTQGVSMSGDLEDPARSLPRGTLLAVGFSTLVYVATLVVFAAALPLDALRQDNGAMRRIAGSARLVDAGVVAATLSSALASSLAAPRILQALAADGVFRSLAFFAQTHGPARNPRRGVLLTGGVAMAVLGIGSLNAIAAVVSMFFLISYGLLNYATYVEATGASPSFRPRFRFFHARASLLGTFLCGGAMLAIDPVSGILALAILGAIHQFLRRTAIPARWRDSRRAYRFRRIREGMRELAGREEGPRDWQPQVLAFTEGRERRERLLQFAAWITGGSGLVTAVRILEAEATLASTRERRDAAEGELRAEIEAAGVDAYPLVVAAPDARLAASTLVQAWGVGPIRANTVLLNWFEPGARSVRGDAIRYARVLRSALRLRMNVVVLDSERGEWKRVESIPPERRRIDVWWFEDDSSELALLLAYLATRTESWDEASIRLVVPVLEGSERKRAANLARRLEELRIDAEINTVVATHAAPLVERSSDATLVFLPLRLEGMRIVEPFGGPWERLLQGLPIVALVGAAADVPLAEPDEETADEPSEAFPDDSEDPVRDCPPVPRLPHLPRHRPSTRSTACSRFDTTRVRRTPGSSTVSTRLTGL